MHTSDIEKIWTDAIGSGNISGDMFVFVQLRDGRVYAKSSGSAYSLAEAKWHLQFNPEEFNPNEIK